MREWILVPGGVGSPETWGQCEVCDESFKPATDEGYRQHAKGHPKHSKDAEKTGHRA
jgi:hypothetical protein